MFNKFFYFLIFTASTLLGVNIQHERPSDDNEQPPQKRFKSALHKLCLEGNLDDIDTILDVTKDSKINNLDDESLTAFEHLMKYYNDYRINKILNNEINEIDINKFKNILKKFIDKSAEIKNIESLEQEILEELLLYSVNKIEKEEFVSSKYLFENLLSIIESLNAYDTKNVKQRIKNDINFSIKFAIKIDYIFLSLLTKESENDKIEIIENFIKIIDKLCKFEILDFAKIKNIKDKINVLIKNKLDSYQKSLLPKTNAFYLAFDDIYEILNTDILTVENSECIKYICLELYMIKNTYVVCEKWSNYYDKFNFNNDELQSMFIDRYKQKIKDINSIAKSIDTEIFRKKISYENFIIFDILISDLANNKQILSNIGYKFTDNLIHENLQNLIINTLKYEIQNIKRKILPNCQEFTMNFDYLLSFLSQNILTESLSIKNLLFLRFFEYDTNSDVLVEWKKCFIDTIKKNNDLVFESLNNHNYNEVFQFLLENNFNINMKNKEKQNFIQIFFTNRCSLSINNIDDLLKYNFDLNNQDIEGNTLLHLIVKIYEHLLQENKHLKAKNPDITRINKCEKQLNDCIDIIKKILEKGSRINIKNKEGLYPIMLTSNILALKEVFSQQDVTIDDYIINDNMFFDNAKTVNEKNDLINAWKSLGVDSNNNIKTNTNRNLLNKYCFRLNYLNIKVNNTEIQQFPELNDEIKQHIQIINCLLDSGIDINQKDYQQKSALSHAISRRQFHIVKLLLDKGAIICLNDFEHALKQSQRVGIAHRSIINILLAKYDKNINNNNQLINLAIEQKNIFFNLLENNNIQGMKELLTKDPNVGIFAGTIENGTKKIDQFSLSDEMLELLSSYLEIRKNTKSARNYIVAVE